VFDWWIAALERRLRDPSNGLSEARVSHLAKYRSLMPALALVCHLADGPGTESTAVTIAATKRAVAWCEYLDAHADRIYSMARDSAWVDAEIARRIETGKIKPGMIHLREIQRMLPRSVKSTEVEAACEALEDLGWLTLEEVKRPGRAGRPSLMAHINPKAGPPTSPERAST
jgi:putative DNA primase/helicase